MSKIKTFFADLLKVQDPEKKGENHFSQSRVYLMIGIITLIGMSISTYWMPAELNANFQRALDTVFWMDIALASYALVNKGLSYDKLKAIGKFKAGFDEKLKERLDENQGKQELS